MKKNNITYWTTTGIFSLLIPGIKSSVKEWAYAGFGITFISAGILHASIGDPVSNIISPFIFLGVLVVSYIFWKKRLPAAA